MSKPADARYSFQAVKKAVSGGFGPYQIECNHTGIFRPALQGLDAETMKSQMQSLVAQGYTVAANEHFTPAALQAPVKKGKK